MTILEENTAITQEPYVSILLLTKNGEKTIESCLNGLLKQSFRNFETLIVDSGSKDNTLKIASQYPVRIIQIPEMEFHHANTRNLAVSQSKGSLIVFIVQDAYPADRKWLEELLNPFRYEKIAATYSRQEPRKETSPLEKAFIMFTYPRDERPFIIKKKNENDPGSFVLLSDVSSAYRKSLVKFDSSIDICEDQDIALKLMEAGYEVAYAPNSVVYHSHNYSMLDLLRRYSFVGNPAGRFTKKGYKPISSIRYVVRLFASTFSYIIVGSDIKLRIFWFIYSIPYNTLKIFAFIAGYLKNRANAGSH